MAQERTIILGLNRYQVTAITLWLAGMGIITGMFIMVNGNINALRAETRADFRALDSRVDALTVEVAELNVRVANIEKQVANVKTLLESIERNLPDYGLTEDRLNVPPR